MEVKKILFINTETVPYVPENKLSAMGKLVPRRYRATDMRSEPLCPNGAVSTSDAACCMKSSGFPA